MTVLDLLMVAVGLLTVAGGALAVTSRNLLHAALWLVVTLAGVAGCYLVLGAEMVALVQLLVYVGAVVVLVLFALMLTRTPGQPLDAGPLERGAAAVVGAATTVLLGGALLTWVGWTAVPIAGASNAQVAEGIFGTFAWPFELLSALLLTSLVAAVAVARPRGAGRSGATPAQPRTEAGGSTAPTPAERRSEEEGP